jgi:hypothetical protein
MAMGSGLGFCWARTWAAPNGKSYATIAVSRRVELASPCRSNSGTGRQAGTGVQEPSPRSGFLKFLIIFIQYFNNNAKNKFYRSDPFGKTK